MIGIVMDFHYYIGLPYRTGYDVEQLVHYIYMLGILKKIIFKQLAWTCFFPLYA